MICFGAGPATGTEEGALEFRLLGPIEVLDGVYLSADPKLLRELLSRDKSAESVRVFAGHAGWAPRQLESELSRGDWSWFKAEARAIYDEDLAANRAIGRLGARLIGERARVMTHCNTGALATAGYGTALGVIRAAKGKNISVIANETRPYLQGARLTAWELVQEGIPCTLITDSMAGHLMSRGEVDVVVVGANRIAANGDVANKIGTYPLAVLAERHAIPFYVAAPISTFDPEIPDGSRIPIEERPAAEVTGYRDTRWAPEGVAVRNPAFDADLCGHERATGVRATDDVDGIATHATLPLVTARAFASAGG